MLTYTYTLLSSKISWSDRMRPFVKEVNYYDITREEEIRRVLDDLIKKQFVLVFRFPYKEFSKIYSFKHVVEEYAGKLKKGQIVLFIVHMERYLIQPIPYTFIQFDQVMIDDLNHCIEINDKYLNSQKFNCFKEIKNKKTIIENSLKLKMGRLCYFENNALSVGDYKKEIMRKFQGFKKEFNELLFG